MFCSNTKYTHYYPHEIRRSCIILGSAVVNTFCLRNGEHMVSPYFKSESENYLDTFMVKQISLKYR